MAQIRPVTSEALEAQIRNLLPSQNGFTEDLQASNVITPIINLTPTAEGSVLRADLQAAHDFTTTSFVVTATTTTLTSTPGFYTFTGAYQNASGVANSGTLRLNDGLGTKTVYQIPVSPNTTLVLDIPVILVKAGTSLEFQAGTGCSAFLQFRQVATVQGVLVDPDGYQPQ